MEAINTYSVEQQLDNYEFKQLGIFRACSTDCHDIWDNINKLAPKNSSIRVIEWEGEDVARTLLFEKKRTKLYLYCAM